MHVGNRSAMAELENGTTLLQAHISVNHCLFMRKHILTWVIKINNNNNNNNILQATTIRRNKALVKFLPNSVFQCNLNLIGQCYTGQHLSIRCYVSLCWTTHRVKSIFFLYTKHLY